MDEQQAQEDELVLELQAQLEAGHPVQFWIADHVHGDDVHEHECYITDVKFEDGYINVRLERR